MSELKLDKKTFDRIKDMAARLEPAPWSYNSLRGRFENADGDGQGHWWDYGPTNDFVVHVRNHWEEIQAILDAHFGTAEPRPDIHAAGEALSKHIADPHNWTVGIAAPDTLILYSHRRGLKCPIERTAGWHGFNVEVKYTGKIRIAKA